MKYCIAILVALVAQCASEVELPPPVYPENCGMPDCNIMSNRFHEKAYFAHPDPNKYYQCAPYSMWEWRPMERWCICGTVFNPKVSRCSYYFGEGWEPICDWTMPPKFAKCNVRHLDGWAEWIETEDDY